MLSRAVSLATVFAVAGMSLSLAAPSALADGPRPVTCAAGQTWSPVRGTCVISVASPGTPAKTTTHARAGKSTAGKPARCVSKFSGKEVPCQSTNGWWVDSWSCYAKLAKPQPPKGDPVWQGHEDGAIYNCFTPAIVGTKSFDRWSATSPAGPAAPPDPRVLALRATKAMQLQAIKIGIVPESKPGSIGIIGLPTWMWVAKPNQHTWGPITRTATADGYSVTAQAKVDRIVWTMGNGDTIVCRTPGTPYADSFGRRSSPDCGYTYVRQGTFTVRATSYWTVAWRGLGQTGEILLDFTQATVITMGEAQVLTRR